MSTLAEIKDAAARLPAEQRTELITWLGQAEDVSRIRREQLRSEIQVGLDEIERGEVAPRHSCARRRLNFAKERRTGPPSLCLQKRICQAFLANCCWRAVAGEHSYLVGQRK